MVAKKTIDFNEVLKRWAIGEVGSKEFGLSNFEEERKKLKSNQFTEIDLKRCLYKRWTYYIPTINQLNAEWILYPIKCIFKDISKFYTINENGWKQKTNGSYKLIDAVFKSLTDPDENSAEIKILRNFDKLQIDDFKGITIIYYEKNQKYYIAEGHRRLIAIYIYSVINKKRINLSIEFAVGITNKKWYFAPF